MSQDIVSDALNQIMNAKRANKEEVIIKRHSKLLISILAIAKLRGYILEYSPEKTQLKVRIGKLRGCNSIKPRYVVRVNEIEKYVKRYLPAKNIGVIIVSTSKGLMAHTTAIEKNLGGSLIAYIF